MEKDAFYFPHYSNARHDRKVKRLRKELGVEGYGIFFMLLEVLRDQADYCFPVGDIDLLSEEFGTSEQKVRTVISNYGLFSMAESNGEECFTSLNMVKYLGPYLDKKELSRLYGIKGNMIKWGYLTKEEADAMALHEIESFALTNKAISPPDSPPESCSDRNKQINKQINKVNKHKEFTAKWFKYFFEKTTQVRNIMPDDYITAKKVFERIPDKTECMKAVDKYWEIHDKLWFVKGSHNFKSFCTNIDYVLNYKPDKDEFVPRTGTDIFSKIERGEI